MVKNFLPAALAIILILNITAAAAITGAIGNSRMVLRMEQGEEIEKYVLVKNVNDIPLTIDLIITGDLADEVELEEESFVLQPKEEKKAYFTITAAKSGTTETKINVKFTPEEGNGVGLSSSVIVITSGEGEEELDDSETDDSGAGSPLTGSVISDNLSKISSTTILTVSAAVLILALLALIIYSINKKKKKVRRSNA
ncbi:hypothetical protein J4402_01495 [Candidatus Pacearchaeota archaeon]|nr:hypothetical protein [Candidatus Pacearchaeota archaeon]